MDEFDLDPNQVTMMNEVYKQDSRSLDRRICACGHAMSRHRLNTITGRYACKPGQLSCACINQRPVIEVPNTRYFMRKSMGSGAKHALPRGVAASAEALGDEFTEKKKWLIDEVCDLCGEESKFYPVRVTATGTILDDDQEDEGVTAFYCASCRAKLGH